jgi:phospholipid N-methyltransferase
MQTKTEVLKACTINGLVVTLPPVQLERKLYQEVAKSLELIGGKWNRKHNGFLFNEQPGELLTHIQNGQKRDIKQEFQFFPTPDELADEMVRYLGIEEYDLLLEPSAGQGAIIKAIHRSKPQQLVHYCELMELNRTFLNKLSNVQFITDDFLKLRRSPVTLGIFDKIIANPPFSKNQDITHIRQMWDCLKPGGRIVTIASRHWQYSSNKTETTFKNWLNEIDTDIMEVEAGIFKESGTNIATCLLIIDKPI